MAKVISVIIDEEGIHRVNMGGIRIDDYKQRTGDSIFLSASQCARLKKIYGRDLRIVHDTREYKVSSHFLVAHRMKWEV